MQTPEAKTTICTRCVALAAHLQNWCHPGFPEENVIVWRNVCDTCVAELDAEDCTALDIIVMETARMRFEKEYDYCE